LGRAKALAERQVGPVSDVADLDKLLQKERARKTSLGLIEAGLKAQLEQARVRRNSVLSAYQAPPLERFGNSELEARLAGWNAALVVQRKRIDELALSRESYVLRAPAAGRVATLVASQGQFLMAGDPILILTDLKSSGVALWVPELSATPPRLGDRFHVRRALVTPAGAVSECVVQAMSPRLELMPQRLWRDSRVAEYGRACTIGPVAALQLVPGERVYIDPLPGDSRN